MDIPETLRQIASEYFDFASLTRDDWISIGIMIFVMVCFVIATNEYMEWKYWRLY